MALTANEIAILIKAKDEASGTLDKIAGKAKGFGNIVKKGALAGGVAIAGLGIASIKMAMDFEKSMAEVKTLLPSISDEGFKVLTDDVIALSKEMGIATSEAVPALYQAISAGVPPKNVMTFMEVASKAAIGGVTDLETAVDGISSVVNAYGRESMTAGRAADVMFTAVRLGKTDFTQLSASLFNVVPIAVSLGISFEEVAGSLAALTAKSIPTSVATTSLRMAFVEASKSGTKLDEAIRELSGVGFADLIAEGSTAQEVFQMLRTSMPEQAFRDLFGSVEALNAILPITGEGFDSAAAAIAEAEAAAGATDEAFKTMSETASFQFSKAINNLKVTLMELGLKALPLVSDALDVVNAWLADELPGHMATVEQAFIDLRDELQPFFEDFLLGLQTVGPVLKDLATWIWDNGPKVEMSIAAIGAAMVLAFGPGSLAVAALIFLIVKIGEVKTAWEEFEGDLKDWALAGLKTVPIKVSIIDDIVKPLEEVASMANMTVAPLRRFQSELNMTVAPAKDLARAAAWVGDEIEDAIGPTIQWSGAAGGAGGAAGAAADAVEGLSAEMEALKGTLISTATEGVELLNAAIQDEEMRLLGMATGIKGLEGLHDALAAEIDNVTQALQDAQDEMSRWEGMALEGTQAFSDEMFENELAVDRLKLRIALLVEAQGKLPENMPGYKKAWDEIDEEIGELDDKVLALIGAGNIMELRHKIEFAPQKREIELMMNPVMEGTLSEIMEGWQAAKKDFEVQTGMLSNLEGQQTLNDNVMVWLLGAQANHQELFQRLQTDRTTLDTALNSILGVEETWLPAIATNTADMVTAINNFQAAVPSAQGGMHVGQGGLVNVHAGETIGHGGGGGPTIVFNGPVLGDQRQAEYIGRAMDPWLTRRVR